jgi:hypothetical protein
MTEKVYVYRRWRDWVSSASVFPILFVIFLALWIVSRMGLGFLSLLATIFVMPFEIAFGVMVRVPILLLAILAFFVLVYIFAFIDMYLGLLSIREIAFSDEGIIFRRRSRPVTIQKITKVNPIGRVSKKKQERGLKIEGLTPEGRKVSRKVMRWFGLTRRWGEFKEDLQQYVASTGGE